MKQFRLLSYLFVAVLCLGFVSCSDDDDPTFEDSQIIGAWTVTQREGYEYYDGEKESLDESYETGSWLFVFNQNKEGYEEQEGYKYPFKWALKGNQLTITENYGSETYKIIHLNESTAAIEIKGKDEDGDYYVKFILKSYILPN